MAPWEPPKEEKTEVSTPFGRRHTTHYHSLSQKGMGHQGSNGHSSHVPGWKCKGFWLVPQMVQLRSEAVIFVLQPQASQVHRPLSSSPPSSILIFPLLLLLYAPQYPTRDTRPRAVIVCGEGRTIRSSSPRDKGTGMYYSKIPGSEWPARHTRRSSTDRKHEFKSALAP
jgi:hypothetical protein